MMLMKGAHPPSKCLFFLCSAREEVHMKQSNFNSKVPDAGEDKVHIYCSSLFCMYILHTTTKTFSFHFISLHRANNILMWLFSSLCDVSSLIAMGTKPDRECSSSLTRYAIYLLHGIMGTYAFAFALLPPRCWLRLSLNTCVHVCTAGLFSAGCCKLQVEGEVCLLWDPADCRQL